MGLSGLKIISDDRAVEISAFMAKSGDKSRNQWVLCLVKPSSSSKKQWII
jgi:hypothetical protein